MTASVEPRATATRMTCPMCGATMNRHAEKIDTRIGVDEGEDFTGLGGALCEIHTCPGCRYVLERRIFA
jgi:hypothetical protein